MQRGADAGWRLAHLRGRHARRLSLSWWRQELGAASTYLQLKHQSSASTEQHQASWLAASLHGDRLCSALSTQWAGLHQKGLLVSKYDLNEARTILAGAADRLNPDYDARQKAAQEILDCLVVLNGTEQFRFEKTAENVVSVYFPGRSPQLGPNLSVAYNRTHERFDFATRNGMQTNLRLTYIAATKTFAGNEFEGADGKMHRENAITAIVQGIVTFTSST